MNCMERVMEIDGKKVKFKATAATPRIYRAKFGRDIVVDLTHLAEASAKTNIEIPDLELFENVAYVMARQADPNIPDDINEWLDGFSVFAIRTILPDILSLWRGNMATTGDKTEKKNEHEDRPITTALIMLRAAEIGISISDLDLMTIGMLFDIFNEKMLDMESLSIGDDTNAREATPEEIADFANSF